MRLSISDGEELSELSLNRILTYGSGFEFSASTQSKAVSFQLGTYAFDANLGFDFASLSPVEGLAFFDGAVVYKLSLFLQNAEIADLPIKLAIDLSEEAGKIELSPKRLKVGKQYQLLASSKPNGQIISSFWGSTAAETITSLI